MLTDIEDSLLAMSEGESALLAVAARVLSSWHGRLVNREAVEQAACRLAKLGLVRWVYRVEGKVQLSVSVDMNTRGSRCAAVIATNRGPQYLRGTTAARQ